MTFDEAKDELVRHRDIALTARGNSLLAAGVDIDSAAFRDSMLNYASDLESWRWSALQRLASHCGRRVDPSPTLN